MSTSSGGVPEWWTGLSEPDTGEPEAGGAQPAGRRTMLLTIMTYFWGMALGGACQTLFGGYYFGSKQQADFHLSSPWLQLTYVLVGILMWELALGILRLEAWVYWAGWLLAFVLAGLSILEIVRWVTGAPVTLEVGVFACLDILFAALAIQFALQPGVRKTFRYPLFGGPRYSPPLVVCVVVLALPSLAIAILVNQVDKHLSNPVLALVYVLTFALMILMIYGALWRQTWTWFIAWLWAAAVTALSVDVIVRRVTGSGVNVQGLVSGIAAIVFTASAVYYLLLRDVRRAFIHARPKNPLFSPPVIIGGLFLAVSALLIYLLPGELGTPAIAFTVFGLAVGAVVGMLPGEDPVARLLGFTLGLLLAFASYVVRGGLLPYTKWWSAGVVFLLLAIITGIAVLFRSTTWFASMLLGAGTLYGAVELQFQAAPSAYLASLALAFVSLLLGFGLGYMVSAVGGFELAPASRAGAARSDAAPPAGDTSPAAAPTGKHAQGAGLEAPQPDAEHAHQGVPPPDAEHTHQGVQEGDA